MTARARPVKQDRDHGIDLGLRSRTDEQEPPIGIEPMTYALREGFGSSRAVPRSLPPARWAQRSARIQGCPGSLLADPLARSTSVGPAPYGPVGGPRDLLSSRRTRPPSF